MVVPIYLPCSSLWLYSWMRGISGECVKVSAFSCVSVSACLNMCMFCLFVYLVCLRVCARRVRVCVYVFACLCVCVCVCFQMAVRSIMCVCVHSVWMRESPILNQTGLIWGQVSGFSPQCLQESVCACIRPQWQWASLVLYSRWSFSLSLCLSLYISISLSLSFCRQRGSLMTN